MSLDTLEQKRDMIELTFSRMTLAAVSNMDQQKPWAEAGRTVMRKLCNNTHGMCWALEQVDNGRCENCSDSEYILKVEQILSAEGLDVGCERKREFKGDFKVFGLRKSWTELWFTEGERDLG